MKFARTPHPLKKSMKLFLSSLLSLLFSCSISNAQSFLPADYFNGVLSIKNEVGNGATAFVYKASDSNNYLVTARHFFLRKFQKVIGKDTSILDSVPFKNGDRVSVKCLYEHKWVPLDAHVYFHTNKFIDIALIKVDISFNADFIDRSASLIGLSQEVYFEGFPLSGLYTERGGNEVQLPVHVPIVKKGIVSGVGEIAGASYIYIDGNNTYGFSGGPVFGYDMYTKKWHVIAVVAGYLKQKNTEDGTSENSGIMYAFLSKYVFDIIK